MSRLTRWLAPTTTARAHCDLPCGVYDPEQARIEAESCHRIIEKYAANEDPTFRAARSPSRRSGPTWSSTTSTSSGTTTSSRSTSRRSRTCTSCSGTPTSRSSKVKASTDTADSKKLLDMIDEIDAAWKATGGHEKTRVAGRPG